MSKFNPFDDIDPIETTEWLESIDSVLAQHGPERAHFLLNQMIVPGSKYWNIGIGLVPGDVEKDDEGISIMKSLGENMAWLLRAVRDAEKS